MTPGVSLRFDLDRSLRGIVGIWEVKSAQIVLGCCGGLYDVVLLPVCVIVGFVQNVRSEGLDGLSRLFRGRICDISTFGDAIFIIYLFIYF